MKILIALAGNGTRFKEQGWETIKPLIRTGNMPMIQKVVDSFNWPNAEYYFITRQLHLKQFPYLQTLLESMDGQQLMLLGSQLKKQLPRL